MLKGSFQIILIISISVVAAASHALLPFFFPHPQDENIIYSVSNTEYGTMKGWQKCRQKMQYSTCDSAVAKAQENTLKIISTKVNGETCYNSPTSSSQMVEATLLNTSNDEIVTNYNIWPTFLVGGEYRITPFNSNRSLILPNETKTVCLFHVKFKETKSQQAFLNNNNLLKLNIKYTRGLTL